MTDQHALDYIRKLYAQEDPLLKEIANTFEQRNNAIQVWSEEGKILNILLKIHQTKTVVEVGTLGGYSAIWMARALPRGGHVHTVEKSPEHAELARSFIKRSDVADKITIWEGEGAKILSRIAETVQTVDAMFIDADKTGYPAYLDWAEAHVRKGGLIIADNTLLFGSVYQNTLPEDSRARQNAWQAMREFNNRLADTSRFDAIMIPTEEGLSIAIRK